MPRPTPQICNWCGGGFTGSDCLGKPCPDCRDKYGLRLSRVVRDGENPKSVSVIFDRPMTNSEFREFHSWMRTLVSMMEMPNKLEIRKTQEPDNG